MKLLNGIKLRLPGNLTLSTILKDLTMLIPNLVEIHLSVEPADMRKSINGLMILVADKLKLDPQSGHLFLFRNKKGEASSRQRKNNVKTEYDALSAKYEALMEQIKLFRQRKFGRSTEKNPVQLSLFDELGKPLSLEAKEQSDETITIS